MPSVGRKENESYVDSWKMEPLGLAVLAGLTPPNIEIDFFDDRIETIDYNRDTDLVAINVPRKLYSVVMTTGGGLYRYRLHDIIKVVGYKNQCPLIQFVSKESNISDLVGEKLNEFHVSTILNDIFNKYSLKPSFFLLAPERNIKKGAYFYALFIELQENNIVDDGSLSLLAEELEKRLEENYHYAHSINLGQLLTAKLFVIKNDTQAADIYVNTCRKAGQKIGNIKPSVLSSIIGWSEYFKGRYIGELNVQGVYASISQDF